MDTVTCYLGNTQELCSILTRDSRLQKSCNKLTVELMNQEEWHTVGVEKKSWGGYLVHMTHCGKLIVVFHWNLCLVVFT